MTTRIPSTLILLALFASALTCSVALASEYDVQTAGQVVVHSRSGDPWLTSTLAVWADMPGMKGAVTLPKGGDLAVTVCLEGVILPGAYTALAIRAQVNGQLAAPYAAFETDITQLRGQNLRFLRFRITFGIGPRQKGQPAPNQVGIQRVVILY